MKTTGALLLALLMAVALPAAAQQAPDAVIRSAVEETSKALETRRDKLEKDREALHSLIDDILLPRFDRRYAAQLVLGRHWRNASPEQRQRFIDGFYNTLLQKYADGVLEFEQDRIEILPYRGDPESKRTMVRTNVTLNDGQKVPVNYALVRRDDGWKIFDLTVEGVSYIRNFRAELDSEIRSSSLEAVISSYEEEAESGPEDEGGPAGPANAAADGPADGEE